MYKNNTQAGFTLVEVMISMLIFAIISTIAYNALQTYGTQQKLGIEHLQKINALQKTSLFIQRDINQVFRQQISLQKNILTLSTLQNEKVLKIRYLVDQNNLAREDITHLKLNEKGEIKSEDKEKIQRLILINNIRKFKLRVLDSKNKWLDKYEKIPTKHIKAIEVSFEHDYWGKIKQWVVIGE